MDAAIDGTFVIIPTGAPRAPKQAAVETCHQLHAIEEIHAQDACRLTVEQDKAFFQIELGFVRSQAFRIAITASVGIHAPMRKVIVEFDIARAVAN